MMSWETVDIVLKVSSALTPIVVPAALYFLNKQFVTRDDFSSVPDRLEQIEQTLIRMESQQKTLEDHEKRLRCLEANKGRDRRGVY